MWLGYCFYLKFSSETITDPQPVIFYTIDGRLPVPFAPVGMQHSTMIFDAPFTLHAKKAVVKAVAVDG